MCIERIHKKSELTIPHCVVLWEVLQIASLHSHKIVHLHDYCVNKDYEETLYPYTHRTDIHFESREVVVRP